MSDLVESWLAAQIPSTRKVYGTAVRDLLRVVGGVEQLLVDSHVCRELLKTYQDSLRSRGLAASTQITRVGAVRSLINHARAVGRIDWTLEMSAPSCWGLSSPTAVGVGEEGCGP